MQPQKLIGDSIKFGFKQTFGNFISWLGIVLIIIGYLLLGGAIAFAIGLALNIILNSTTLGASFLNMIFLPGASTFVAVIIPGIPLIFLYLPSLALGVTHTYLRFFDSQEIKFRPLFNMKMIFSYYISTITLWCLLGLYILACRHFSSHFNLGFVGVNAPINLGLILLIMPGFIVYHAFMFTTYYIVDKNLGPMAAIQASWNLTWNNVVAVLCVSLAMLFINMIPLIGILVTSLISVYLYRKLEA